METMQIALFPLLFFYDPLLFHVPEVFEVRAKRQPQGEEIFGRHVREALVVFRLELIKPH